MSQQSRSGPEVPPRHTWAIGVACIVAVLVGVSILVHFVTASPQPSKLSAGAQYNGASTSGSGKSGAHKGAIPGPMPGAPTVRAVPSPHAIGPKPLHASHSAPLKTWNRGPGGTALQKVTAEAGSAMMADSAGQFPEMLQYCTALTTAVRDAAQAPAIPDSAMQKEYTAALNEFRVGTTDCAAGISQHPEGVEDTATSVNKAVIARALQQFEKGQTDLYVATETLRKQ
jgi:hypothetical protein